MPTSQDKSAPGLKPRPRSDGTIAWYWVAANCSRNAKEYTPKTVRLANQLPGGEAARAKQCRQLHLDLQLWLTKMDPREKAMDKKAFNGTIAGLIRLYRNHPESSYHNVKYNTRKVYDWELDQLNKTIGQRRLASISGVDFLAWYRKFCGPDGDVVRTASKLMNMLRIAIGWGVVMGLPHCERLRVVLTKTRFAQPPQRSIFITFDQVEAVIKTAHEMGYPSMALAQALQFEFTMRQKDVIGEWEPHDNPGGGAIMDGGERWSNGLLWSHIDSGGVVRKMTTKVKGAEFISELAEHPLVVQELARFKGARVGPMIIDEDYGLPYKPQKYTKRWRKIAAAAGIPPEVKNMDSRAGGITEATDAGAPIESVRHHATHRDSRTTMKYSRQTLAKTKSVAQLRALHRKPKT